MHNGALAMVRDDDPALEERTDIASFDGPDARTLPGLGPEPATLAREGEASSSPSRFRLSPAELAELRARLRDAEAREEPSGIRVRPVADDLEFDIEVDVELEREVEAAARAAAAPTRDTDEDIEEGFAALPELTVSLDLESVSTLYAGFDPTQPEGVFVATHQAFELDTALFITMDLPGGFRLRAPALVEWRCPNEHDAPGLAVGLGLRFAHLDGRQRKLIEAFARLREPLFYTE